MSAQETVQTLIFTTNATEGVAQTTLSLLTGALQAVATDLRAVHETLAEDARPESLTAHLRSAIECVLSDYLEPATRTLGRAAIATPIEVYEAWEEEERWQPAES